METYYLKATDENALWVALESADLAYKEWDMSDPLNTPPAGHDPSINGDFTKSGAFEWVKKINMLDMVGIITQETGIKLTDEYGNEYPEMEAVDGFHANLRVDELTDEQIAALPIVDAPATPYRKWAGDE